MVSHKVKKMVSNKSGKLKMGLVKIIILLVEIVIIRMDENNKKVILLILFLIKIKISKINLIISYHFNTLSLVLHLLSFLV